MTLATLLSRTLQGLEAPLVRAEVDVGPGLPTFSVVGLLETAVKESKDRVRAALSNCGFDFPAGRVTVNLAPADLPKDGGRFDLAIAIGILVASGQLPAEPFAGLELYGELSLGGELHGVRGVLPSSGRARTSRKSPCLPTVFCLRVSRTRSTSESPSFSLLPVYVTIASSPARSTFTACDGDVSSQLAQPRTRTPSCSSPTGRSTSGIGTLSV